MSRRYIPRKSEKNIKKASEQFPVVVLTGPRQTGKSTLLQKLFPDYDYVTFDDPVLRESCRSDPSTFIDRFNTPCIIDEIQYVPEILPYIKIKVDKRRDISGQFILTGSQIFPLMKGMTESLAGRAAVFELFGFSMEEYDLDDPSRLFDRILCGGYPDPLIHQVDRISFYSSYLQTYLERDIRQIQNVQDLSIFLSFLELLAGRVGNILNLSEISKILGVSQPTVKRWLSLLESSRIIYLLRPYFKNINKRIVKSPKIYFTDTGLLTYILRYPDSATLAAGPANGAVFENFVIMEFLKQKAARNSMSEFFFYRDNNQSEIDLIIDYGFRQELFEIKLSKNPQKKQIYQLQRLKSLFTSPSLYLISTYENVLKLSDDVSNLPFFRIPELAE
ncbi:ATP-binding protein [Spirochaeta isovalerica]|uniref:ATP-binding protein n=1 Tax=Spirochaeta isovalerica TaxID=150 RepID=A0A841RD07_9SPIO|nr:ATP-binding protein [Spirochaeta isovalerica]MBB6480739.1 hypothetical protein [Spirochaeta isovalerica]